MSSVYNTWIPDPGCDEPASWGPRGRSKPHVYIYPSYASNHLSKWRDLWVSQKEWGNQGAPQKAPARDDEASEVEFPTRSQGGPTRLCFFWGGSKTPPRIPKIMGHSTIPKIILAAKTQRLKWAVVKNGALVLFIGDDTGLSCLGIMKWPWESWLLKQPGFHGLEDDRCKKK